MAIALLRDDLFEEFARSVPVEKMLFAAFPVPDVPLWSPQHASSHSSLTLLPPLARSPPDE